MKSRSTIRSLIVSRPPSAWALLPLVRLMVGWIFLFAGLRKFLEPVAMGPGRFAELGLPSPEVLAPIVGAFEIVCGLMLILGLFVRVAAIPLIVIMVFAIGITKVPDLAVEGIVAVLHAARLELTMIMAAAYLVAAGGGPYSLDRSLERRLV
jgi:putative oxidoreductase